MTHPTSINFDFVSVTHVDTSTQYNQFYSFITYNAEPLVVITDPINLIKGSGIPMLDSEREKLGWKTYQMYQTDSDRNFLKIKLDPKQKSCGDLKAHFELADAYFGSDIVKKQLFGQKKFNKYKYLPIIRIPLSNNDEDSEDESEVKSEDDIPYCKLKFDLDYSSGMNTTIIKKNNLIINNMQSITDICQHVRYNSKFESLTFAYAKIWITKYRLLPKKEIMYGVTLKIKELNISTVYEPQYAMLQTINLSEIKKAYGPYVRDIKNKIHSTNILEIEI